MCGTHRLLLGESHRRIPSRDGVLSWCSERSIYHAAMVSLWRKFSISQQPTHAAHVPYSYSFNISKPNACYQFVISDVTPKMKLLHHIAFIFRVNYSLTRLKHPHARNNGIALPDILASPPSWRQWLSCGLFLSDDPTCSQRSGMWLRDWAAWVNIAQSSHVTILQFALAVSCSAVNDTGLLQ